MTLLTNEVAYSIGSKVNVFSCEQDLVCYLYKHLKDVYKDVQVEKKFILNKSRKPENRGRVDIYLPKLELVLECKFRHSKRKVEALRRQVRRYKRVSGCRVWFVDEKNYKKVLVKLIN